MQVIRSIILTTSLDIAILQVPFWTVTQKISLIFTKYAYIIRFLITKKFILGESYAYLHGAKIYYNAPFGIAPYQFIIKTQYPLLKKMVLPPIPTIIDIGANVGYFSKLCRNLYPDSHIYAFEPIKKLHTILQRNFLTDQNTNIVPYAVSNKKGPSTMQFNELSNELSSINPHGTENVQTIQLDEFYSNTKLKKIDLLKIDTESHEREVLETAMATLEQTHYLLIELTIQSNNYYTIPSLLKMLDTKNYKFQLISFRPVPDSQDPVYMDALFENKLFTY